MADPRPTPVVLHFYHESRLLLIEAELIAVLELDAIVASHTSGLAVASQMNLYRCDH